MAKLSPKTEGRGFLSVDLTGSASTALGYLENPEGVTLQILRVFMLVKTASTGSATLTVGVTTTSTTTSASDILNALTINGVTADTVYMCLPAGDTAKDSLYAAPAPWTTSAYVTFTGSATTAGFTGTMFIEYLRLA